MSRGFTARQMEFPCEYSAKLTCAVDGDDEALTRDKHDSTFDDIAYGRPHPCVIDTQSMPGDIEEHTRHVQETSDELM